MMPKLSGFEVCETAQRRSGTKRRVMVLMVTALNELGDIERAVAAGTDDFLSKPVNKIELLKRVDNMLKLKGTEDELERSAPLHPGDGRKRHRLRAAMEHASQFVTVSGPTASSNLPTSLPHRASIR